MVNHEALQPADGAQIEGQGYRRSDGESGVYQGGRAVHVGVVCHFASGIEQTDRDAAGNENSMYCDESQ